MNLQAQSRLDATGYDRAQCKIGIVHIGLGAFHRAHQAVYVDRYLDLTGDLNWGIAAVNLRANDSAAFAESSKATDGYLLKTTSPEAETRYQLIRAHVAHEDWAVDRDAAEALVDIPSVQIISMTVTESGYFLNNDWTLNIADPVMAAEISGADPTSIYGYLARALSRRAAGNGQPVTIMCCDNIRSNGVILERNFKQYLEVTGRDALLEWVCDNVSFPCSMVDRITPRSTPALLAEVAEKFPGRDLAPIHGESFIQWVVADKFAGEKPDLDKVGVQIVDDVEPFEEAKIRILNGGHSGMCYFGALAGYQTFDEIMHDPELRGHFERFEYENVLPAISTDLPFDARAYVDQIAARFGNRAIADDLARICMDGWSKMQIFIVPTLDGCLRQGISPVHSYECVASWYVYARRVAANAMAIPYQEPFWDDLLPLLSAGQEQAFAECAALWADLPNQYGEFAPGIVAAIDRIEARRPA